MSAGFIAETDALGRVVWVWRKGSDERYAKPVRDVFACRDELKTAQFSGAAPEAISDWFARQTRHSGSL